MSEVTNSVIALLSPPGPAQEKPQTAASATPGQTLATGERERKMLCQQTGWANKVLSILDGQGKLEENKEMRK